MTWYLRTTHFSKRKFNYHLKSHNVRGIHKKWRPITERFYILKWLFQQICTFVYKCLETADKEGYTSIGIPALGTGNMGYPHDVVATYMYNTVEKFATDNEDSKLMVVKFVVYGTDTRSIQVVYLSLAQNTRLIIYIWLCLNWGLTLDI